jgi:hypothetical protein
MRSGYDIGRQQDIQVSAIRQTRRRHYHLVDSTAGNPTAYSDELFPRRREAVAAARERATWVAALTAGQVEPLTGHGRYLVTTGRRQDPGRTILVEQCDDQSCLEMAFP